jgi:hypothetical protein
MYRSLLSAVVCPLVFPVLAIPNGFSLTLSLSLRIGGEEIFSIRLSDFKVSLEVSPRLLLLLLLLFPSRSGVQKRLSRMNLDLLRCYHRRLSYHVITGSGSRGPFVGDSSLEREESGDVVVLCNGYRCDYSEIQFDAA